MSDKRFEYDEDLLLSCARSPLAASVAPEEEIATTGTTSASSGSVLVDGDDAACSLLHEQHAMHYHRDPPSPFVKSMDTLPDGNHRYVVSERVRRFLQSVLHIQSHNSQTTSRANTSASTKKDRGTLHRVTLNQFADEDATAWLLLQHESATDERNLELEGTPWNTLLDYDSLDTEWLFDYPETIDISANLTIGNGGTEHLNPKTKKKARKRAIQNAIADKITFPNRETDPNFAVPPVDDPNYDGVLLRVQPRHKFEKDLELNRWDNDPYGAYLNWATDDNPDGVPIVHDPIDQGECGSCWAFAAAGSLEASVSRRQAHDAYTEYLEKATLRREKKTIKEIHWEAIEFAKSVEKAAFNTVNLSIQELIDCDTAADQGCVGGNPLLAFYFIHRYGLSTRKSYPYVGYEDTCDKKSVSHPIAKARAWGLLSPNHENHMELVLRYVGPIAVGVNGGERSFLGYRDGIFDKPNCRQGANHALLIVGYGEEKTDDGIVKYWIARNSWGRGWGIDGYVKLHRGDGAKGTPGVCGIARSPSVALGGILLQNRHRLAPYHGPIPAEPGSEPLGNQETSTVCSQLGIDSCSTLFETFENHRALILGLTGILCATLMVAWPLTLPCRRQRQRRKARRQILTREGLRSAGNLVPPPPPPPTEADPLLGSRSATVYGA